MSRTYNTDPYEIQLYRRARREVPVEWRAIFVYRVARSSGIEWTEWQERNEAEWDSLHHRCYSRMDHPGYGGQWAGIGRYGKALNRQSRARERQLISHERYDAILPRKRQVRWLMW